MARVALSTSLLDAERPPASSGVHQTSVGRVEARIGSRRRSSAPPTPRSWSAPVVVGAEGTVAAHRPPRPVPQPARPPHHRPRPAGVRHAGRRAAVPGRRHGHRRSAGDGPLAGLALAASVLLFVTSLCSFLAYGTTPRVARARGAGDPAGAASVGVQALWLALLLGLPLAVALAVLARPVAQLLGGEGAALDAAVTYLRISAIGVPFVLVAIVGAGVFRGVADLRTPLAIVFDGERRQPARRAGRRLRPRPGHRRLGVEHRARPDRGRRRLPGADAAAPARRAVAAAGPDGAGDARCGPGATSCCGSCRSSPRSPSPPRSRRGSTPRPSRRTRSSTPCSPCWRCRWTRSPSPRRRWWPRRSGAHDPALARQVGERVLVLSVVVGGRGERRAGPALAARRPRLHAATPRSSSRVTAGLVVLGGPPAPGRGGLRARRGADRRRRRALPRAAPW